MKLTADEWKRVDNALFLPNDPDSRNGSALRDLFALGCYAHANGNQKAGITAIKTALSATPFVKEQINTGLLEKITTSLPGNEKEYLNQIRPHTGILGLIE